MVITSGVARRPGMSRDDLLLTNMKIVTSVVESVVERSPNCILLVVTNPLDAMAQRAYQVSGFPKNRVVGDGRDPGHGAVPDLLGPGARCLRGGRLGLRPWRPRRHDGAGGGQHHRRWDTYIQAAPPGPRRPDCAARPRRRRRDRRPAQDWERLLRALGGDYPDGGGGPLRQERRYSPARPTWRASTA